MTDLSDKMRALAATGHPRSEALIAMADKHDELAEGYFGEPQTVQIGRYMGAWARARRLWSECRGEPLI